MNSVLKLVLLACVVVVATSIVCLTSDLIAIGLSDSVNFIVNPLWAMLGLGIGGEIGFLVYAKMTKNDQNNRLRGAY